MNGWSVGLPCCHRAVLTAAAPVDTYAGRSFILTDDQAIAMDPAGLPLGDMQPMKRTRELLMDGGLHMENCALPLVLLSAVCLSHCVHSMQGRLHENR